LDDEEYWFSKNTSRYGINSSQEESKDFQEVKEAAFSLINGLTIESTKEWIKEKLDKLKEHMIV